MSSNAALLTIRRSGEAEAYDPPGHAGVGAWNLHGPDAGGPEAFRVAVSTYEPGGRAQLAATASDVVYVVLEGTLRLHVPAYGPAVHLHRGDSVHLGPGTERELLNDGASTATILVVAQTGAGPR